MAPSHDTQLEKVIDEVLKSGDIKALDVFLQQDIPEGNPIKCSQQFITKLDKLVDRYLDQSDSKSACLGLTIIYKCGKNLRQQGDCHGLSGLVAQGLLKKWFEKCRQLWIKCGPQWDETLFDLSEDFFEALMVVHDSCKEGTYKITETLLYPVGQLVVDPRIYILIQKEAIRKFNLILDKIPVELKKKKKILTSQEASDIMMRLAGQILEVGDYDLQTALMEALCRMATPGQRRQLADQWFSMEHVANAFTKIHDSEFETDCRKFLNLVNGMQGDRRRVYSYPCLEVYLDKYELLMPADEKLEEFWIDFNLGSNSISFYFSLANEEAQEGSWETICINENEVQSYTVTEEGKRHILQLKLSEVVVVGAVEGSSLTIHFSSCLEILQAARSIYGQSKNKEFAGKRHTSVVKTTVKIIMEENSSQVVPESQESLSENEKNTAPYLLPGPSAPVRVVTPAKKRMSESTTFISSSGGGSVHGASSLFAVMHSNTSARSKERPSLEMVHSCDSKGEFYSGDLRTTAKTCSHGTIPDITTAGGMIEQNIPVAKAVHMDLTGQGEEQSLENGFVPDTQPRSERNIFSTWNKLSVSEMLMMPTQKISSLTRPESHSSLSEKQEGHNSAQRFSAPVSQKQLHTELTQRLQQVLNERNQGPSPQEPAALQGQKFDIRGKSKDKLSKGSSTVCAPTEQQAQRNSLTTGKKESKMSLEADASLIKAPPKISTTEALQKRKTSSSKAGTNSTLSSKEKRDAEVAGSMVKLISSRYESGAKDSAENIPQSWKPPLIKGPIFNMSWRSMAKREDCRTSSLKKSYSKTETSSTNQRKDIFSFNTDESSIIGGKNKSLNNTSAIWSSGIHDSSAFLSTAKKEQPVAKEKRHVKKHLFSDTDTDCAATEVSWLRESNRKPKPKVTKYSRQAAVNPKAVSPHTSYEFPDIPLPTQKPVKDKDNTNKKLDPKDRLERPKGRVKAAAAAAAEPSRPPPASRRPQRAAAACTKSYKDPDTDDSQSESEELPVPKYSSTDHLENAEKTHTAAQVTKKKTASKQPTKSQMKLESNHYNNQSKLMSKRSPTSKGKTEKTCAEIAEVRKRKNTSSEHSADTYRRLDPNNLTDPKKPSSMKQERPKNVVPETSKLNKKNVSPVKKQMNALKDSWAACQTSFCSPPPSIERMRSAERSAPTSNLTCSPLLTPWGSPLPASPDPPCQDTLSPVLLLPKPHSAVSSKASFKPSSLHNAEKKRSSSKTHSIQSVRSLPSLTPIGQTPTGPGPAKMGPVQQPSPPRSPVSLSTLPLLTSTLLELDKHSVPSPPQSLHPEDTVNNDPHYSFSKVSSSSLSMSSTKSSVLSCRVQDSLTAVLAVKTEKTPPSERDPELAQLHISGPSRKRHISSSSNFEEDEKEEKKISKMRGQHSPRLKPRKLFKSFAEVSSQSEESRMMSSSHIVSSNHWEAEFGDGDMDMDEDLEFPKAAVNPSNLCQQFSSELKKKFQNRHKMIEVYNRQSLKSVQQHVSSLDVQVTKYRTQRLEKVRGALLEEIHKLEQDDTVLKSMEEDLDMHWKKQSVTFHTYQEQRNQRNNILTKALRSNMGHSLEYEERIFTSQMCLIRKDMKSVQDRLLSQMQEGELQSVKRGLHALFFP